MNHNARLGRGLSSLLGEKKINLGNSIIEGNVDRVQSIALECLIPNKYQPRKCFDEEQLQELSASIKEFGVLQPVIVRKIENDNAKFEIIAGERRHRAAKIAGLNVIPVIIKEFTDKEALSLALIENIQRSDLSVMEEADAYNLLFQDFNLTQQQISDMVGKSRSHVANLMRLISLPDEVKQMLINKQLEMGHARAILNSPYILEIASEIISKNLNVRETERLVKDFAQNKKTKIKKAEKNMLNREYFKRLEQVLIDKINLKTKIEFSSRKKSGRVVISYSSPEELDRLIERIGK